MKIYTVAELPQYLNIHYYYSLIQNFNQTTQTLEKVAHITHFLHLKLPHLTHFSSQLKLT